MYATSSLMGCSDSRVMLHLFSATWEKDDAPITGWPGTKQQNDILFFRECGSSWCVQSKVVDSNLALDPSSQHVTSFYYKCSFNKILDRPDQTAVRHPDRAAQNLVSRPTDRPNFLRRRKRRRVSGLRRPRPWLAPRPNPNRRDLSNRHFYGTTVSALEKP